MKFLKKMKDPKQENIKEKKELSPKLARTFFCVVLVCLVVSAPAGFLLGKNANVAASQAANKIKTIQEQLVHTSNTTVDTTLATRFLNDFLKVYMNKSDDENAFTARQNKLDEFMVSHLPKEEFKGVKQELEECRLYDFTTENGTDVAQYAVTYKATYPVEKERKVKKKVDKKDVETTEKYKETETKEATVLVNVPFIQKGKKFKVAGLPYYSKINDLVLGDLDGRKSDQNALKKVDDKTTDKVTDFLKQFYKVYTSGDVKQVTYMMANPEVLTDDYQVESSNPKVYEDGKGYLVYDSVIISEKNSDNGHMEQLILHVSKKDGNFYIDKFEHDFGGN